MHDTTQRGLLPAAKEPGGFWVSNELIDLHATKLGGRGLYVYLRLLRSLTGSRYPTLKELAAICCLSEYLVNRLLLQMHGLGLLNDYDVEQVLEGDDEEEGEV